MHGIRYAVSSEAGQRRTLVDGFNLFRLGNDNHRFILRGLFHLRNFGGLATVIAGIFFVQPVSAATYLWTGIGTNANWLNPSNWAGGVVPANDGTAAIVFKGTNQLSPNADTAWDIASIVFTNGAGAFVLGGNPLTIRAGGITNNSANPQTINNAINLRTNQTWSAAVGTLTFNGNINVTNLLTVLGSLNSTINGVISGVGGLTKLGTGTNTLAGANTYSGLTAIGAGVVNIRNVSALGSTNAGTVVSNTASLQMQGGIFVVNELLLLSGSGVGALGALRSVNGTNSWGGPVTLAIATTIGCDTNNLLLLPGGITNSTNGTSTNLLTFSTVGNIAVAGNIGGAPGGLTKSGAGTLTLTGTNSYGGLTTVSAGVLNIRSSAALGTTALGTTVASGAALQLQGGFDVAGELLTLSGTGLANSGALRNISGSNSWSGPITLAAASTIDSDADALNLAANITNATFAVTFTNVGTIILGGALGSGTGALTKIGSGTLIVNGANTYTGATTISAGVLQFGATGNLPVASAVTVNTSGILDLNGFNESILSLAGAGGVTLGGVTLTVNNTAATTYSGVMNGTGGLTKASGVGTLTLSGANTYTGDTTINAGAISIAAANGIGNATNTLVLNGGTLIASVGLTTARPIYLGINGGTFNETANATLTLSGVISGPGALTKIGTRTLALTGNNTYLGGTTNSAGTISISSDSQLGDPSGPFTFPAASTLTTTASFTSTRNFILNSGTATFTAGTGFTNTFNGVISGAGALTKAGTGVLALSGNNTFTNLLTISAGIVRLGANECLSDLASVLISSSSATFDLNGFNETIGSLYSTAAGKVTLGNGFLTAGGNNSSTIFTGVISGTGGFTKSGTGTMTFSGANTYTNTTTIAGGTLQILASERIANASPLVIVNGATFDLNLFNETIASLSGGGRVTLGIGTLTAGGTGTANFSGNITGFGSFTKIGTGTQIFSGTNSYTGATSINVGHLQVNGSSTNSPVTMAANTTLSGNGAVGTVAVISSSTNSPGANSPGTLTTASQTWAGGGNYRWEINDAAGARGVNHDWLNISGALTINATSANKFNIKLISLTPANAAGQMTNFDNTVTYIWTILTASGGISGFSAGSFNIDTSSFQNPLGAGAFSITQNGNDLNLIFTTAAQAAINNVQSGTLTSTGNGTNTVTLGAAVNPNGSFLIFNTRHNSSVPGGSMIRGRLVNSNTVEFVRATSETSAMNIQWYVAEYSAGVKVQRGEINQDDTTLNVPLSPISSTSQAFVLWSKTPDTEETSFTDSDPVVGELTSVSNLQFRVTTAPSSAPVISWQVVEFTHPASINVQKGSLTNMTGTNLLATATLNTAVDPNGTFLLTGYRTSGSGTNIGARMLRAQLTSATSISIDRSISGAPDNIAEIAWQAVHLKDGSLVQSGSVNFPAGIAQTNISQTYSLNTNRAIAFSSVQPAGGQNAGRSPSTGNVLGVGSATLAMTGISQVTLDRNNTNFQSDLAWSVIGLGPGSILAPASGGAAISADTKGGAYTSLTGPVYTEIQSGNVSAGTIILKAPTGFIFDTNAPQPTVLVTRIGGNGANSLNINGVASGTSVAMTTVNPTNLIFTVTSASFGQVQCSLTWQNLRVRPTAGAPLANGNILSAGASIIQGVTTNSTSWGSLNEVVGAANKLAFQTKPSSTAVAGIDFSQQPVILIQDQFGNLRSEDNSTTIVVTNSGTGVLGGATNSTAVGGVAAFSGLDYNVVETIKLGFAASGLIGTNSANIVVSPAAASQLTILTQPSSTATAGMAFSQQPVIRIEDPFGNLRSSDNSTVVTADIDQGTADLSGGVSVTAKNGVVTFTNLVYPIAETVKIVFSSGTLDSDTSTSILVNPASQTITFGSLSDKIFGDADFTVSATASSGLPVAFSILSGPATVSGNVVSLTGAGTVTVRASQSGNTTYAAATSVDRSFTVSKANSSVAVDTSANPSPTSSNVTFTATVSSSAGTPTGTIQFLADGTALGSSVSLSGGIASVITASLSHGTHIITAQYAGDGNFLGSTNTLSPNQVVNTQPVAATDVLKRYYNADVKVRISNLLTNDSDSDGDTLVFVSADAASANGGTVVLNGNWLTYKPADGFTNSDSFYYIIADAGGIQATGLVSIVVCSDATAAQNAGDVEDLGGGSVRIHFNGIPGRIYQIQYTESLETPDWQSLGTTTADAQGKFEFTDSPATNSPPRFYRSTDP